MGSDDAVASVADINVQLLIVKRRDAAVLKERSGKILVVVQTQRAVAPDFKFPAILSDDGRATVSRGGSCS